MLLLLLLTATCCCYYYYYYYYHYQLHLQLNPSKFYSHPTYKSPVSTTLLKA